MTADVYPFSSEFLSRVATRIVNEVQGINRVVYDYTSKPPAPSNGSERKVQLLALGTAPENGGAARVRGRVFSVAASLALVGCLGDPSTEAPVTMTPGMYEVELPGLALAGFDVDHDKQATKKLCLRPGDGRLLRPPGDPRDHRAARLRRLRE
jgi:hypothetical protein